MPRPSQVEEKRRRLLPVIARAFGELGYRRATTAELAERCGVRENVLYRLWSDKREMFLAAIRSLFEKRQGEWEAALEKSGSGSRRAEKLIEFAAQHYGDESLARVIFSGLAETDDAEIREALARLYRQWAEFFELEIQQYRESIHAASGSDTGSDIQASAWSLIGLGTILNIVQELKLVPETRQNEFFATVITQIAPILVLGKY